MTTVPLPLGTNAYKNVNEEELTDQAASLIDGFVDELGFNVKRPGLNPHFYSGTPSPGAVRGVYWWADRGILVWTHGTTSFNYASSPLSYSTITSAAYGDAPRHTFASDGTYLYIATGGRILRWDGTSTPPAYIADADAPTQVTHIAFIDTYLLANSVGTAKFYFSEPEDASTWAALDFASANSAPDDVTAFYVINDDIQFFGPQSAEIWQDDGVTPFSTVDGGAISVGCVAPYSIVPLEGGTYFLDSKRRVRKLVGRSAEFVSTPYDAEFAAVPDVSDCVADAIEIGGRRFIHFTFPSSNRTFLFEVDREGWSEAGRYRSESLTYDRWKVNCHAYVPDWNKHFCGSALQEKLFEMSFSYQNDGDGDVIRVAKRTGHLSFGTLLNKRTKEIRFVAKRGHPGTTVTPKMMLRYKINGRNQWSNEIEIDLGDPGETDMVCTVRRRKIYKKVQYEFSCSDAVPVAFGEGEEELEVLER